MADKPTLSLLEAVRSQLTVDSDSDSSQSTAIKVTLKETPKTPNAHVSTFVNTPLDRSVSSTSSMVILENTNDHEPFPDFDEKLAEEHEELERAFSEAVMAAIQNEIRTKDVDPAINAPPGQPEIKRLAMDRIKDLLSNPDLRESTRKRFIVLTNMVIRLDLVLFRRSEQFLGKQDTADAMEVATEMLKFFTWVDNMLRDLVAVAENIFGMMGILVEEDCSVVQKYQHMSTVAAAHLRKPRFLEQRLLSLYLDLYDEWIHNRFLYMSNRMICSEEKIDPACLTLTRQLHEIWDILSRATNNYATYTRRLNDIRKVYLVPTLLMIEMPDSPEGQKYPAPTRELESRWKFPQQHSQHHAEEMAGPVTTFTP